MCCAYEIVVGETLTSEGTVQTLPSTEFLFCNYSIQLIL
jgi:hypothetical protein